MALRLRELKQWASRYHPYQGFICVFSAERLISGKTFKTK